jgi:hypothetical protein
MCCHLSKGHLWSLSRCDALALLLPDAAAVDDALLQTCAGLFYCFSLYSPAIKAAFGFDQAQIQVGLCQPVQRLLVDHLPAIETALSKHIYRRAHVDLRRAVHCFVVVACKATFGCHKAQFQVSPFKPHCDKLRQPCMHK